MFCSHMKYLMVYVIDLSKDWKLYKNRRTQSVKWYACLQLCCVAVKTVSNIHWLGKEFALCLNVIWLGSNGETIPFYHTSVMQCPAITFWQPDDNVWFCNIKKSVLYWWRKIWVIDCVYHIYLHILHTFCIRICVA